MAANSTPGPLPARSVQRSAASFTRLLNSDFCDLIHCASVSRAPRSPAVSTQSMRRVRRAFFCSDASPCSSAKWRSTRVRREWLRPMYSNTSSSPKNR